MTDLALALPHLPNPNPDPFQSLPPELLATIFNIIYDYYGPKAIGCKLRIGSVCSRWRRILWGMPHLWTTFSCVSSNPGVIELLELHASNAENIDFSITLSLVSGMSHSAFFHPLCNLVFSTYSEHIHSLKLSINDKPTWNITMTYASLPEFSHLETLGLALLSTDNVPCEFKAWRSRLPRLRSLSLTRPTFDICSTFPLHNITSLHLEYIHPDYAFYLLSQCPQLARFHVKDTDTDLYTSPDIPDPALTRDVIFAHLTHFEWDQGDHSLGDLLDSSTFIRHLRFPAVRHLDWTWFLEFPVSHWEIWEAFFRNMECLEQVRIVTEAPGVTADILVLLSGQPIHRLRLDIYSFEELQTSLNYLVCDDANETPRVFANLEALEFYIYCDIDNDNILPFLKLIVSVLVPRRPPKMRKSYAAIRRFDINFGYLLFPTVEQQGVLYEAELQVLMRLRDEGLELGGSILDLIAT